MPRLSEEEEAVQQFLQAFKFTEKVDVGTVRNALFSQRQLNDVNASQEYVEQFVKKCERRDPASIKPLKKRIDSVMAESDQMVYMMDFLIRCRQAHLFHNPSGAASIAGGSSSPSMQSSPFQRRSASRTRVLSTLSGDPQPQSISESQRSRANSSFSSYDNNRMIGIERQQTMSSRAKSPFRINHQGVETTRASPLTASNHLFSPSATYSSMATPTNPYRRPVEDNSSYVLQHRVTPTNHLNNPIITPMAAPLNPSSRTPLHARMATAMTHPEPLVCECLLKALLGIETPIFTLIHRKMTIASTASLSMSHTAVARQVLLVADLFLLLSHKEAPPAAGTVSSALIAAIRLILGHYTIEIDALRRQKNLKMHQVLPLVYKWHCNLTLLAKAHRIRSIEALDLLENLYVLHRSYSCDEGRKEVLDTVLEYTMGVFCRQMMDWMTTGEVPDEKFQWMIRKDPQTGSVFVKKIPVFMDESDARILLEIGKSLPHVESASDEDLAAIDKATTQVRAALKPAVIFKKELTPLLEILRDVVCGIVMRMVLTTGRLREHLHKATSFFFLTDPRFTITLYRIIKDASLGLRVGSASLSRQQVSSALASALEATTFEDNKKNKLKFTLDALTSLGNTPNVSSRMQFVQPLRPKYEPALELMKPIFGAVDDDYEAIFHVIWAIDLARLSSEESAAHLPPIIRFLLKAYTLRENAWSLLNIISHVFYVINSTLTRVRSLITMQVAYQLARFLAAIDEKCVDMDDVIQEHRKFVKRVSVVTYVKNNEQIEQELSNLLRVSFEAQEFCDELTTTWHEVLESTAQDANVRKAKVAECCQKRVLGARILLETVNKSQKKLSELLDHQITFGNEALIE